MQIKVDNTLVEKARLFCKGEFFFKTIGSYYFLPIQVITKLSKLDCFG